MIDRPDTPIAQHAAVRLFWTGGWDSTFRLLQLLLIEQVAVQPYYIHAPERSSSAAELTAMETIAARLTADFPASGALLLPLQVIGRQDLEPDAGLSQAFDAIRSQIYLGSQYEWLAFFCKQHGINDMELAIHLDDKAHLALETFVVASGTGDHPGAAIDPRAAGSPQHTLFQWFRFPIFNLSKVQMALIAETLGWQEIMEQTWFCHRPTAGMRPCGICNPCIYTYEEGLGRRIPADRRILLLLARHIGRPLKRQLKKLAALR